MDINSTETRIKKLETGLSILKIAMTVVITIMIVLTVLFFMPAGDDSPAYAFVIHGDETQ